MRCSNCGTKVEREPRKKLFQSSKTDDTAKCIECFKKYNVYKGVSGGFCSHSCRQKNDDRMSDPYYGR